MDSNKYQKGAQSGQNGAEGTKSISYGENLRQKAINKNKRKTIFREGRFQDSQSVSVYSARIPFFPDLCRNIWVEILRDFGSPMEKTKQKSIPEEWRKHDGQEMQHVVISFELLH